MLSGRSRHRGGLRPESFYGKVLAVWEKNRTFAATKV